MAKNILIGEIVKKEKITRKCIIFMYVFLLICLLPVIILPLYPLISPFKCYTVYSVFILYLVWNNRKISTLCLCFKDMCLNHNNICDYTLLLLLLIFYLQNVFNTVTRYLIEIYKHSRVRERTTLSGEFWVKYIK